MAMPTRVKRINLTQQLVRGCAVMFGACLLIQQAQAQFIPPPAPPPPPPVFNPSPPNTTVPQPSYTPLSPTTPSTVPESIAPESTVPGPDVTSPVNENPPRYNVQSGRRTSVAKTRSVHHHRVRFAGPTLGYPRYCGDSPCVRIRPSAFYRGPASGLWWPGFYDYAPGQFGRGRPHYSGYWRPTGYHGD
jgi:hypothetical protein